MRAEFKVNLKRTKATYIRRDMGKFKNEPPLRQFLVLAHQVKKTIETQPGRTLKEISEWLGLTRGRISQILNYLSLSPRMQEEILLSANKALHQIPEHQIRKIMRETQWDKQWGMWKQINTTLANR